MHSSSSRVQSWQGRLPEHRIFFLDETISSFAPLFFLFLTFFHRSPLSVLPGMPGKLGEGRGRGRGVWRSPFADIASSTDPLATLHRRHCRLGWVGWSDGPLFVFWASLFSPWGCAGYISFFFPFWVAGSRSRCGGGGTQFRHFRLQPFGVRIRLGPPHGALASDQ